MLNNIYSLSFLQGYLLSSSQQQVGKLVLQTGEAARTLRRTQQSGGTELPSHLVELCEHTDCLIADAEHSKQVSVVWCGGGTFLEILNKSRNKQVTFISAVVKTWMKRI